MPNFSVNGRRVHRVRLRRDSASGECARCGSTLYGRFQVGDLVEEHLDAGGVIAYRLADIAGLDASVWCAPARPSVVRREAATSAGV